MKIVPKIRRKSEKIHNVYKKANIDLKPVPANFAYNSGSNPDFLTVDQIRQMICKHLDPSFQPI